MFEFLFKKELREIDSLKNENHQLTIIFYKHGIFNGKSRSF